MDSLNSEECSAIDGTASGTCAEGYGVCCIGKIKILFAKNCPINSLIIALFIHGQNFTTYLSSYL